MNKNISYLILSYIILCAQSDREKEFFDRGFIAYDEVNERVFEQDEVVQGKESPEYFSTLRLYKEVWWV